MIPPDHILAIDKDAFPADRFAQTRLLRVKRADMPVVEDDFYDRPSIEENETLLQPIPYIVFTRKEGREVLTYTRPPKGGDSRLQGKKSLGIGGHVEYRDFCIAKGPNESTPMRHILEACYLREIKEELGEDMLGHSAFDIPNPQFLQAWLYDSSTPVGRVHLGYIYVIPLNGEKPRIAPSAEILDYEWQRISEIISLKDFEDWSRIVLSSSIIIR